MKRIIAKIIFRIIDVLERFAEVIYPMKEREENLLKEIFNKNIRV